MSDNPTDLHAQQMIRDEKRKLDAARAKEKEDDFRWLMGSKRGRRIVWGLLEEAGVFRLSFNTNAMSMSFAEGNRNAGLRTLMQIHTLCPELYPTMIKENRQ